MSKSVGNCTHTYNESLRLLKVKIKFFVLEHCHVKPNVKAIFMYK